MNLLDIVLSSLQSGVGALASYLAAHVLLCLLPAFLIAGALAALFPKEAVTRYLGQDAKKWISYPAAALGGFVLAVCSCTIMPLFASIYKKGAGLGPAITFLFVGPAINIMAISFTGVQIGMDIALARVLLSLIFGILIGIFMQWIFRKDEKVRAEEMQKTNAFTQQTKVESRTWVLFGLLLAVLLVGTLPLDFLRASLFEANMTAEWAVDLQGSLNEWIPATFASGFEGLSVHGIVLIGCLILITIASILGFRKIDEEVNVWTLAALALMSLTLVLAAVNVSTDENGFVIGVSLRTIGEILVIAALWFFVAKKYEIEELQEWLWEMWRFEKQIIPLLLVGIFAAGVVRNWIPAQWIQAIAGKNTLLANFFGVAFGIFMYFPTLVEVPIAQTFLSLGMHRGPLLAYLLADPELSIQSILITNKVIGKHKTAVYVSLVAVFSTLAGYLFGLISTNFVR
ncbi:MAG: permease [Anaerolineae bacterium]|nr:permease [Anaerolineae bacterium]